MTRAIFRQSSGLQNRPESCCLRREKWGRIKLKSLPFLGPILNGSGRPEKAAAARGAGSFPAILGQLFEAHGPRKKSRSIEAHATSRLPRRSSPQMTFWQPALPRFPRGKKRTIRLHFQKQQQASETDGDQRDDQQHRVDVRFGLFDRYARFRGVLWRHGHPFALHPVEIQKALWLPNDPCWSPPRPLGPGNRLE